MTEGFACARCGACCRWPGHVYLLGEDVERLARGTGVGERAFVDRYARLAPNRAGLVLAENPDGSCVFLENDRCLVYPARPLQCREFPTVWSVEGPDGCPASRAL